MCCIDVGILHLCKCTAFMFMYCIYVDARVRVCGAKSLVFAAFMCVFMCIYIYMYIHVYIYIYL